MAKATGVGSRPQQGVEGQVGSPPPTCLCFQCCRRGLRHGSEQWPGLKASWNSSGSTEVSWRSLPAPGRGSLGDKSPIFPSAGFFSGIPGRAWLVPALAPLLPSRLGFFVCCGHSLAGSLGLVWVIGFGM